MLRLDLEKEWERKKQGKSLGVFYKNSLRNDGNLMVMGDGEKQILPRYIFSVDSTVSANSFYMECERRRTPRLLK